MNGLNFPLDCQEPSLCLPCFWLLLCMWEVFSCFTPWKLQKMPNWLFLRPQVRLQSCRQTTAFVFKLSDRLPLNPCEIFLMNLGYNSQTTTPWRHWFIPRPLVRMSSIYIHLKQTQSVLRVCFKWLLREEPCALWHIQRILLLDPMSTKHWAEYLPYVVGYMDLQNSRHAYMCRTWFMCYCLWSCTSVIEDVNAGNEQRPNGAVIPAHCKSTLHVPSLSPGMWCVYRIFSGWPPSPDRGPRHSNSSIWPRTHRKSCPMAVLITQWYA